MNATQEVRAKRPYTPRELAPFTCEWCAERFESRAQSAKFCSPSCRDRARYARSRDKRLAAVQEYRKVNSVAISGRSRLRRQADPAKQARQQRESYLRNRELRIADAVAYQRAHPEVVALTRHRRRSAECFQITQRDHRRILSRYRGCCAYCEVRLGPWGRAHSNSLQWDHVLPLARGGRDSVGNLLPSCRDCNRAKSAKLLSAWRHIK